jgi:hypothetical protein
MAISPTATVRLDEDLMAGLDEVLAYMKTIAPHGMKPTRSDAIRFCITGWLADHRQALREASAAG